MDDAHDVQSDHDAQAGGSRPSMVGSPDVPTTFVQLMMGMTEGTAWAPIETILEVFPSIAEDFEHLALWALRNENDLVMSWCLNVLEADLLESVRGFVSAVCEVLPQWQENGVLMVSMGLVDGTEGPRSKASVLGITPAEYEGIERGFDLEAGTLKRWRDEFEAMSATARAGANEEGSEA